MKPKFNPDQSLARKVLLGEPIERGTLVTHSVMGATYPFLGMIQYGDGETRSHVMKIGLFQKDGGWVTDSAGGLGQWCIAVDQNRDNYDHLKSNRK